jgi:basic membrane lipoprotein Med (substrate-binding protein (PBP1-ABC) superfamily)
VRFTDRRWRAAGAAGALALALLVAGIVLLVSPASPQAPVRARQYTTSQACLLTDSRGITSPPAATVWAGMEDASLATHAMVTYLSAYGPATAANAIPYANSLIERHCDVVLAVGAPQTGALSQIAPHTPKAYFVIVGSGTNFATANLKTVGLSADTRSQVKQTVEALVNS